MSDIHKIGLNLKKAASFNKKAAKDLGWYGKIPADALSDFPDLALDPVDGSSKDKTAFAQAVYSLQCVLFDDEEDQDGCLGVGTRKALVMHYNKVPDDVRHYLHYGMREAAPERENASRVITYKDDDGYDLHRSTKYDRKGRPLKMIVLHWSGTLSLKGCYNALRNKRNSSHFGVRRNEIYQWMDTEFNTAHGGVLNRDSIGIDICLNPDTDTFGKYVKYGFNMPIIKNTTGRGDSHYLDIDPDVLKATQELILDMCAIHDIPLRVPRGEDGLQETGDYFYGTFPKDFWKKEGFNGIVGHHHANPKKSDVAVWWKKIFDPLFA